MIALLAIFSFSLSAQDLNLQGAWQRTLAEGETAVTQVLLFSGNYFSWTEYRSADGAFGYTKGGSWQTDGNGLAVLYEFNSADTTQVGQRESWGVQTKASSLQLILPGGEATGWSALDQGISTDLTGPWLFSGRLRDGEISRRDTDQPRKTMKLLTGSRFQWIAYHTGTGRFLGTGGGTYEAVDGTYTEHIGFFSRDDSRVGADLSFSYEIKDGEWHHSGKSSKGDPMYEVWARRE